MTDLRVTALVPARGGSKGIPGKNLRELGGKPLLQWALEAAQDSGAIQRVLLSTDSQDIADLGKKVGLEVPFIRPPELAADDTPMQAVIEHLIGWLRERDELPDAIALLQPTAPLRKAEHIRQGVKMMQESHCDSVVGVEEIPQHFSPHYAMRVDNQGKLINYLPDGARYKRRQDVPTAYSRDGTLYLFRISSFERHGNIYGENCLPLVIPQGGSLNLDTMEDWENAERYFAELA
ncbi:MAG: cytidylyltransferase domain-containing protein [Gammaproteobacteria bacterium]